MDEFSLIERYFRPLSKHGADITLGIGDDAAIFAPPEDSQLVVTTDTQVESVHFPPDAPPHEVGFRSCVTSLSDIAAMGACARWASLALTMPRAEPTWLTAFTAGVADALQLSDASLIGGDTTAGRLSITWHVIGVVPTGTALRRDGATMGDDIYVSGTLGDAAAALALKVLNGNAACGESQQYLRRRYWRPLPPLSFAEKLRGLATSCIDISDGLIADLSHLAAASDCGARVELASVPLSSQLLDLTAPDVARGYALSGGDDYELCFSAPPAVRRNLVELATASAVSLSCIGRIVAGAGVEIIDEDGRSRPLSNGGYRHFS